jgi:hypothetical protein
MLGSPDPLVMHRDVDVAGVRDEPRPHEPGRLDAHEYDDRQERVVNEEDPEKSARVEPTQQDRSSVRALFTALSASEEDPGGWESLRTRQPDPDVSRVYIAETQGNGP